MQLPISIYYIWAFVILLLFAAWMITKSTLSQVSTIGQIADDQQGQKFIQKMRLLILVSWMAVAGLIVWSVTAIYKHEAKAKKILSEHRKAVWPSYSKDKMWSAPDAFLAETDQNAELIAYGRDLIVHTQDYFGPNGLVAAYQINSLNCQSCHLEAGTKAFGNNYSAVASTYPLFRARSGTEETIAKRVNDCFERSLNGVALDSSSREMEAIKAYISFLGTSVPKGERPKGSGLAELPFLPRAASPDSGLVIYQAKCASCHGSQGEGLVIPGSERFYPPLWGEKSFNESAGLFRLSRMASYVKSNMPFGASYENPQLTDAEAWDVAAYICSQPRPKHPFLDQDWPDISKKPFDHPFAPFSDTFPVEQHKYGPFEAIIAYHKGAQKKENAK